MVCSCSPVSIPISVSQFSFSTVISCQLWASFLCSCVLSDDRSIQCFMPLTCQITHGIRYFWRLLIILILVEPFVSELISVYTYMYVSTFDSGKFTQQSNDFLHIPSTITPGLAFSPLFQLILFVCLYNVYSFVNVLNKHSTSH